MSTEQPSNVDARSKGPVEPPSASAVRRLRDALHLETPLIAVYDGPADDAFGPLVESRGHACCFAYYRKWLEGQTLVIRRDDEGLGGDHGIHDARHGCPGAQTAFGLRRDYPPYMAHFLTDGRGAPEGEGLKATPALAQAFLDHTRPPAVAAETVLLGPLRLSRWERVRSVTFLVDPDRLAAVMTLAAYWSSDPDLVAAPFSSGCGLMLRDLEDQPRDLEGQPRDRAVLGCTDIAMRKYLPPEILSLSVTRARFAQMLTFPDGAFLSRNWWGELMAVRGRRTRRRSSEEGGNAG